MSAMLDGYRDSIPRMLEQMKGPMKAIIGPWNHTYPDPALPGYALARRNEGAGGYWLARTLGSVLR